MLNRFFIPLSVIILIALSFFRESVFVNINTHMWHLFYHNDKTYLAPYLSFLQQLSYSQFYWFKWALTVFFSLLFLFLSCIIIQLVFKEKKFIRWTIYSFAAIMAVSALAFVIGKLLNRSEDGYIISHFFMGMIQSPFVLIFLIPAFKLAAPSGDKKTE